MQVQDNPKQPSRSDRVLLRCSIYFGILATMIAGLVGLGQESWSLPTLVGISALVGVLYTDLLRWFSIHRFLVYVLMITGAIFAVGQFLGDAAANRLLAVGNLLVYVQLPLIFQKKTKRVFEQWGVFLLLELVVGALVNDNVLYGVLMLPILAIGTATMIALAQYASQLRHGESQCESISMWAKWMHWIGRESSVSKKRSGVSLAATDTLENLAARSTLNHIAGWRSSILPISFSVLLFSAAYFYTLPRTQVGAYEPENWFMSSVGFSEQVSLKFRGDIRQNETPMFRMQMLNELSGSPYRPNQPPYVRLTVLHKYFDGPTQGVWEKGEPAVMVDRKVFRAVPKPGEMRQELATQTDRVIISIIEKNSLGEPVPVVAPFAHSSLPESFIAMRRDWRLADTTDESRTRSIKRRFSFRSYGFLAGEELALLPSMNDCLPNETGTGSDRDSFRIYGRDELTEFPISLSAILPFRDQVLKQCSADPRDKVARALFLEQHFATSQEFKYSLRNTPPINSRLDPIADFLLNKRSGHCEYYASSLAILLRSMNIPTRLVSGFRPSEYNEVGGYFLVQQKHAHVWVEAYFTVEELKSKALNERVPSWVKQGMWLRMDPTPSGDGSNARGSFREPSGQTFGVMQDLWSEMILNMDKTRQSGMLSIFAESSQQSYNVFWSNLSDFLSNLQSSRLMGGLLSPEKWFSWKAALTISFLGFAIIVFQRVLMWMFPQLGPRLSVRRRKANSVKVEFFRRITQSLQRLGLQRNPSQTPREFLIEAAANLKSHRLQEDAHWLADCFYAVRFGRQPELSGIDKTRLESLITSLDQLPRTRK